MTPPYSRSLTRMEDMMGDETAISWANHTFNIWIGCTHAPAEPGSTDTSPECDNCYAEQWDRRDLHGEGSHWGPDAPRRFMSDGYWRKPLSWNRAAERTGIRSRVFCSSLADVFEYHADADIRDRMTKERERLWRLIQATPCLDWLLLTKRPENFEAMLPWGLRHPRAQTPWRNVWLGVTAGVQRSLWRVDILRGTPAAKRFVSMEPLLELIGEEQIDHALTARDGLGMIDWLIVGDESTPGQRGARPADPNWVCVVRDACIRHGTAFHFKQWAGADSPRIDHDMGERKGRKIHLPIIDGRRWAEFPR